MHLNLHVHVPKEAIRIIALPMESPDIVWAKRWAELNTVNKWEVELDPRQRCV